MENQYKQKYLKYKKKYSNLKVQMGGADSKQQEFNDLLINSLTYPNIQAAIIKVITQSKSPPKSLPALSLTIEEFQSAFTEYLQRPADIKTHHYSGIVNTKHIDIYITIERASNAADAQNGFRKLAAIIFKIDNIEVPMPRTFMTGMLSSKSATLSTFVPVSVVMSVLHL